MTRRTGTGLATLVAAAMLAGIGNAAAAPHSLSNGAGDGTVTVGVDGFGSFGSSIGANSTNAAYNPVGAGAAAGTTFESGIAIGFGAGRTFLSSGDIGGSGNLANPTVTGSLLSANSTFSVSGLSFTLSQDLAPLFTGGSQTGSVLIQTYTITNTSTTAPTANFEVVRYIDGDLVFDGSIADGGGRIVINGTEILFETDTAAGTATATTFLGITGEGGSIPAAGRYEVDSFSGLRGRIVAGSALDNLVTGDGGDADQFIDAGAGYDVTLALRNTFSLAGGATTTYTTRTFFGSGAPEEVGSVPEPGTLALLGIAVAGMLGARRKRG